VTDTALRKLAGVAVCLVAAIAAVISYEHVYHLAVTLGQPKLAAWLMPSSVDGSIGAASAALLSAARLGLRSPRVAQAMLALGVLATLTANAYSGSSHGIPGMALAMWPGIAFIGSTETALSIVRKAAKTVNQPVSVPGIETLTASVRPSLTLAWPRPQALSATGASVTKDAPKPARGKRTRTASAKRTRIAPVTDEAAALRYAPEIAQGRIPSMRQVRTDLRVGQARAQAIVRHLNSLNQEGAAA
jgi:Protein of unknown function (DUF2637)